MSHQRWRRYRVLSGMLCVLALLLAACASGSEGVPGRPGQYEIRKGSVSFDGDRYQLLWQDAQGGLHRARGRDFRLVQDERNFLEVDGGSPILHVREDEPISVEGEDNQGGFSSFWFPFLLGQALSGPGVIGQPAPGTSHNPLPRTPSYRYPPSDTFGRGETLHGTVNSPRPQPPDYGQVRPVPGAVSGQAGGAGGGTAATAKGGFKSGPSSYTSRSGTLKGGKPPSVTGGKPPALNPGKPALGGKPAIPRGGGIRVRR